MSSGLASEGPDGDPQDSGHVNKKLRSDNDLAPTGRRWTNAAALVDPFNVTQAVPGRNKAREILEQVKKQQNEKTKSAKSSWGESNYISLGSVDEIDFRPPPPNRNLPRAISGTSGPDRRRAQGMRGGANQRASGRGRFSHRDNLHANGSNTGAGSRPFHPRAMAAPDDPPGRTQSGPRGAMRNGPIPPTHRRFAPEGMPSHPFPANYAHMPHTVSSADPRQSYAAAPGNVSTVAPQSMSEPRTITSNMSQAPSQSKASQQSLPHNGRQVHLPGKQAEQKQKKQKNKKTKESKQNTHEKAAAPIPLPAPTRNANKSTRQFSGPLPDLADDSDSDRGPPPSRRARSVLAGISKKRNFSEISKDVSIATGVCSTWRGIGTPWAPSLDQMVQNGSIISPERRLHREIECFFTYVQPQLFETNIRHSVVDRLKHFLSTEIPGDSEYQLRSFGSFPSGLHLPDADIDLVVLSPGFEQSRTSKLNRKQVNKMVNLHQFAQSLTNRPIRAPVAERFTAKAIPRARVPIVKYVDRVTGIRVDVSFDNKGGLPAVQTCKEWAREQPALPVLVSLIKVYLVMREVSDVSYGGLGGFSVICLVYFFLKTRGHYLGQKSDPLADLGSTFLSFLDFFGERLDAATTGIQLQPELALFEKSSSKQFWSRKRLCIVDPHNETNDISVGSTQSLEILKSFAEAKKMIEHRMQELSSEPNKHLSVLGAVFQGDYSSFEEMRGRLRQLWTRDGAGR